MNSRKIIQSVDRALKILDLLAKIDKKIGVTEISKLLNTNKSTTYGILATLEENKYIQKDEETKKYSLGLKFLQAKNIVYSNLDIKKVITPQLKILSEKYQEAVHYAKEFDNKVIYLEKIESSRAITMSTEIGSSNPLYCTAVGKVILAFKSEDEIDEYIAKPLKEYTKNTLINRKELKKELKRIQKLGYSIDNEEIEIGLRCIATPIKDHNNNVIGSISVSGPSYRMSDEIIDKMKLDIIDTAKKISRNFGNRN